MFPHRTSLTPTDEMAFVGDPQMGDPLMRPEADEIHVSVTFTWDMDEGERLAEAWGQYYPVVKLGGPAYGSSNSLFEPGKYVRSGVTFTSRGCNRRCPWCLVPAREGRLKCGPVLPGYIVNDNNFLQCGRDHQLRVFEMLSHQRKAAVFSGGLDARLVKDWVAEQFASMRIADVFLAADTKRSVRDLERAVGLLPFLRKHDQLHAYVLIAYNGETIPQATERLRAVWATGCLPYAQLYQPPERKKIVYSLEWEQLQRTWARPPATRALMEGRVS